MHVSHTVVLALASLISLTAAKEYQATIWSWPLSSQTPAKLAHVSYDTTSNFSTSLLSYTPPKIAYTQNDRVRVGLYDPKTSDWTGIVTSAASFDPQYRQQLSLHIDESNEVYHVGLSAFAKMSKEEEKEVKRESRSLSRAVAKATGVKKEALAQRMRDQNKPDAQVLVEIIKMSQAPTPVLNKPVVLNPDGKLDGKEPEKSFLQKYVARPEAVRQRLTKSLGTGGSSRSFLCCRYS